MPRKGKQLGLSDGSATALAEDESESEFDDTRTSEERESDNNGIATQPQEKEEPVFVRSASQQEIVFSQDILERLQKGAQDMGAEAVVDALMQLVDVHPLYVMPADWPGTSDEVLHESEFVQGIVSFLCRGCSSIEVSPSDVVCLFKNQRTWSHRGVQIRAAAKRLDEVAAQETGKKAAVIANFPVFQLLNTRAKVAAIYHALRSIDAGGSRKAPQVEGWIDEYMLFGTGTTQTDVQLARAIEIGSQRQLPFDERKKFDLEAAAA